MGLFNFVRNHQPAGFNYKPRFYNEEKEDLRMRIAHSKGNHSRNVESMKVRISHGLQKGKQNNKEYKLQLRKKSNFRLVVIFFGLLILIIALGFAYLPALI